MSKAEGARQAKRPSTAQTVNGRPRIPSGRLDDGELGPSDSASNANHRRAPSGSQRPTVTSRQSQERRTEKTHVTTKETLQLRTRSPTKQRDSDGSAENMRSSKQPMKQPSSQRAGPEDGSARKDRSKAQPPSTGQWRPQATLIPQSISPLASRISLPPLASETQLPLASQPPPLHGMPLEDQENAIIDDLLFAFMGYEGQYIRFDKRYKPSEQEDRLLGPSWRLAPGLDPSLKDLTNTMLKMATHYISVDTFVEVQSKEHFGMINHALCASIRRLLREYLVLVAQMEHQLLTNDAFTLHVLHLHTMPTAHALSQLYMLSQEILRRNDLIEQDSDSDDDMDVDELIEQLKDGNADMGVPGSKKMLKGGSVLRLLTDRLSHMSGDPEARKLLEGLLSDASRPYMKMLNEWLHRGTIKDPHGEFVIRELQSIRKDKLATDYTDEYWDKRYTIRESDVPPQLESVKGKVLLAGKYLNVVRECGGVDISTEMKDVPQTFEDSRFLQNITDAYSHANSSLLRLLLTSHELSARLRSLKHYFFLDRSDFFNHFLYLSNSELKKPMRDVNVGKLQSLLDLVLRQPGSVAAEDPFKEDVKVHMNHRSLTTFLINVVNVQGFEEGDEMGPSKGPSETDDDSAKMSGFESLEFDYSVPFPLSLVISSKTIIRYQVFFRYLLSMRHLEGLIVNCWEDHTKIITWTHKSKDKRLEAWKRRVWTLRSRMLNYVQQFIYYCTAEVIEPNWHALMAKVNAMDATGETASKTVDELMDEHVDFLDTCLKECMLMNPKLLKIHDKLVNCCTFFAAYTTGMSRTLLAADSELQGHSEAQDYLGELYPNPRHPPPERLTKFDPDGVPKIIDSLAKYEDNFNRHIRILLDALDYYAATETVALSRLCAMLSMASEKGGEERLREE